MAKMYAGTYQSPLFEIDVSQIDIFIGEYSQYEAENGHFEIVDNRRESRTDVYELRLNVNSKEKEKSNI
jgi:hypothetical protein